MGTRVGHVVPGLGFFLIGLWHLYNHIKLYCKYPKSYNPPTWFPVPKVRRLELYFIFSGSLYYIISEIFLGPSSHRPLDPDWTIPASHLHNFEHATITLAMLVYAAFALRLDSAQPGAGQMLAFILAAGTFAVELLVFYVHSTDHVGLEGQYHWLLQTTIVASAATTLMGIGHPRSFAVGFTRSVSVMFQGVWFVVLGVALYTPSLLPKGCHLQWTDGFFYIPCDGPASLHRAKALANLLFAWTFLTVVVLSAWFYLHLAEKYPEVTVYEYPEKDGDQFPASPKKPGQDKSAGSLFLRAGKGFEPMEVER